MTAVAALPFVLMTLAAQPSLESLYAESLRGNATPVSAEERAHFRDAFRQLLDSASTLRPESLEVLACLLYTSPSPRDPE